jgi:hypothetical protein
MLLDKGIPMPVERAICPPPIADGRDHRGARGGASRSRYRENDTAVNRESAFEMLASARKRRRSQGDGDAANQSRQACSQGAEEEQSKLVNSCGHRAAGSVEAAAKSRRSPSPAWQQIAWRWGVFGGEALKAGMSRWRPPAASSTAPSRDWASSLRGIQ